MTTDSMPLLLGLSKEGLTVADRAEDVRGYRVSDKDGHDIGEVDELIVEDGKHIVRFLRVAAGGFLGLGAAKFLIPVDAITSIDNSPDNTTVHIDRTHEHVASGPPYDPDLINKPLHLTSVYEHYGLFPYWAPGYLPAGFPYYH